MPFNATRSPRGLGSASALGSASGSGTPLAPGLGSASGLGTSLAAMDGGGRRSSLGGNVSQHGLGIGAGLGSDVGDGKVADEDEETIDSVLNRLAIERRVQYGAEKMLDVIEARSGGSDAGDSEQVKQRITAQLEAANERIKSLETKLEKLERMAGGTPSRNRRRPPPRLNGYPSSSSLGLGQSLSSQNALSAASSRPRIPRQNSNLTPDLENQAQFQNHYYGSPPASRFPKSLSPARQRSRSTGEEAYGYGSNYGYGHGNPNQSLAGSSYSGTGMSWGPMSSSELSSMGGMDEEKAVRLVEEVTGYVRRLRDLVGRNEQGQQRMSRSRESTKGKEKEERSPLDEDAVWDALNGMAGLFKRYPSLKYSVNIDLVVDSVMPFLMESSPTIMRAASYRLIRTVLDRMTWGIVLSAGIEWPIVRSLTRDSKSHQEKEQVIQLLRSVTSLPPPPNSSFSRRRPRRNTRSSQSTHSRHPSLYGQGYSHGHSRETSARSQSFGASAHFESDRIEELLDRTIPLPEATIRSLVSVAENPEDQLRTICMETLVEIALLDIDCLIRADAFRVILLVFKDGPPELGPAIVTVLLHLVDRPSTRSYLLAGSDVETILVGLTEEYGKIPSRQRDRYLAKLENCAVNIGTLLSSWPGVIYLGMDDGRAYRSLLSALQAPSSEVRNIVLELFFSALRIQSPAWSDAFLDGKRLTVYNRTKEATSALQNISHDDAPLPNLTIADHFISYLLLCLLNAGLLSSLVELIEQADFSLGRKATLLLGEVLQMANRLFPAEFASRLQSLPQLFSGAVKFSESDERHFALTALSSIDSFNRNLNKGARREKEKTGYYSRLSEDSLDRSRRQMEHIRLRQGLQIDDKQFLALINDSGVMLGRDHTKWNYDIIMDLINGPLLNPKRLDEAIKATKFVRRLFSFFHPTNNQFSSITKTGPNHKWVDLGCALISTMLVNPEGIRFMAEDKLLKQLADCFDELDQYVGVPTAQPVLARNRVNATLTYGYFELIGTLSSHPEGIKLMERFKLFTSFYHLSEQRSRDDLIRIIIECFDYTLDSHPRIVLAKALTSAYMETRLFATHHLARLLQESPGLTNWALQLMITQLYDTSMEVCDVAVMYLEEICTDPINLEKVVQLRPTLEHLGELGQQLFMRFVSTSTGFTYLNRSGYIERELDAWTEERNLLYVIEAETFVTRALQSSSPSAEQHWLYEGTAPVHFLGELCKTPEGCLMLRERGIVPVLAETLRLHGLESNDQGVIMGVKSALWALGNIGSTEGGLGFLEDEEIVDVIVEIAETSPVLTLKGTAFFVIGLLSTSRMGAEIIEEYGWIATLTPMGRTTGLCLPNDLAKFNQIEPWKRIEADPAPQAWGKLSDVELEIMTCISNLSNYVLANGAMNRLKRLRNREPRHFSSIEMFHRAARMISTNHYQAPVRRFILDLFDVAVESDTLEHLVELDHAAYSSSLTPNPDQSQGNGRLRADSQRSRGDRADADAVHVRGDHAAQQRDQEQDHDHDHDHDHELRRRSASSPGPPPIGGKTKRDRGLTISGMASKRYDLDEENETPTARATNGFESQGQAQAQA